MNKLNGKTALVTGASRGIGRAIALALAQGGAQVLVHYSSNEKKADAVVAEIRKDGGKAQKVGTDLRKPDGAHTLAKLLKKAGFGVAGLGHFPRSALPAGERISET